MITLSQAYKLCGCDKDYGAWLRIAGLPGSGHQWLSDKKIRERLDMKKVKVIKIDPYISISDGRYEGMEFTVTGITSDELWKISMKG